MDTKIRKPEWISVEDRLPEENRMYLIAVKDSSYCHLSSFNVEDGEFDGNVLHGDDITHWMPLPEPPKPKVPTFKDVFLKKFPKAPIEEDGIPKACIANVFPWAKHKHCDGWMCSEDWNQPYFEEEEKE